MTSNEARVYFSLAGYSFNPDDITRLLGIEPTSVNRAGATSALDKPAISCWELSTDTAADEIDVYLMTRELMKKIEPLKDKLVEAIERYNLAPKMSVVLLLSLGEEAVTPDVGFGSRAVKFLAEIGAFIDIEYQLSRD